MGIKNLLGHKSLMAITLVYCLGIAWLSLAKFDLDATAFKMPYGDKLGHLLAYAGFVAIWFMLFFLSKKLHKRFVVSIWLASGISFSYGIVMEIVQKYLTDYRNFDGMDVVANTCGIILAMISIRIMKNSLFAIRKSCL